MGNLPLLQYYTLLHQYLWPQWRRLLGLGTVLLAGIGLQLLPLQLMGRFLDMATTGSSLEALTRLAALVIGVVVVQQLCAVLAAYLGEAVAWTATNRLRHRLMEHCLHLDLAFHHAQTPGEMIERLDSDVTVLANFFFTVCGVDGWQSAAPAERAGPAFSDRLADRLGRTDIGARPAADPGATAQPGDSLCHGPPPKQRRPLCLSGRTPGRDRRNPRQWRRGIYHAALLWLAAHRLPSESAGKLDL